MIVEATKKSASLRRRVEKVGAELEARTVGGRTKARRKEIRSALDALETELFNSEPDEVTL